MRANLWSTSLRLAALALACGVSLAALAQHGAPANGEWRTYGGDLGNTRYSPLDQIDARNFNQLEVAWRFKTDNLGPSKEYNFQSTPLMVDGVVYSTAGIAPRGRRARRGQRRAAVDASARRGRARQGGAAPAFRPRPRVLAQRRRRAHRLRDAGLPARRTRRTHRPPGPDLRQQRRRRSQAERRSGHRPVERRDRPACDARHRKGRRSSSAPRTAPARIRRACAT